MNRRTALLLTISLLFSPLFCKSAFSQSGQTATVAEVDGERISAQELKEASGEDLATLEEQAYRLKQQKLEELIDNRLLSQEAKRRSIPLDELIRTEVTAKAKEVTSEEIHRVYELNKSKLQRPESEVAGQLRTVLIEQNTATRRHEFANTLRARAQVTVYLDPPAPYRAVVGLDGPSRGAPSAPVTIVEFEDFQCPFCRKAQDTLQQVLLKYKDSVRFVHRDFPLQPLHPASWKAHEAARCAAEQGKFWEYRDLLYKNAPAAPEQLPTFASQLGLDSIAFKTCLESGKFKAAVQKDEDEGDRLGVQGTPFFFINGRPFPGAQPESEFSRVIDEELNKLAHR
ncbi:MAG TPA: thioredoxin domain-containing protein [Candidatus Aquilonibacter sp.]|nr:thioredoxin domain-containing protein [Candidatus Aquilonibacter sp.]